MEQPIADPKRTTVTQLVVFWTLPNHPFNCCLYKSSFSKAPSFVLRSSRVEISPFIKLEWVMQSLTSTSHLPRSSAKSAWELGHLHFGTGHTWSQCTTPAGLLLLLSTRRRFMRPQFGFAEGASSVRWRYTKNKTQTLRSLADSVTLFLSISNLPRSLGGKPATVAWKSALQATT